MAHVSYSLLDIWQPDLPAKTPILGNTTYCDAIRQPGTDKGLVLALVGGEWQIHQTLDTYEKLVLVNGSVEYLSTVLASPEGPLDPYGAVGSLTLIDDTLYASVTGTTTDEEAGRVVGNGIRYARIMRDTSPKRDGSGPWVLHASLPGETTGGRHHVFYDQGFGGGEILVRPGIWVTTYPVWGTLDGGAQQVATQKFGLATSADNGLTWTERLQAGWYAFGIYGYSASRNFAKRGDTWYIGGWGDVDSGQHWMSTDLITWTSIGNLGRGNSSGRIFPMSDPDRLWSYDYNPHVGLSRIAWLQHTEELAVTDTTLWTDWDQLTQIVPSTSTDTAPRFFDLNPEAIRPEDHLWCVSGYGKIQPLQLPTFAERPPRAGYGVGQINLVQYRYTPVSVNVGYEYGSVETFDYARAMQSWTDRLTDSGVPIPFNDPRRP